MNDDLDLIAGFAASINQETAQQNARIQNPNEGELIAPVKIQGALPTTPQHQQYGVGDVVPQNVPQVFNSDGQMVDEDGVIDIPPELLQGIGGGVTPQAQPHPPTRQPIRQPIRQPTPNHTGGVFHPDLQSTILRMLITMTKNQEKIIKVLLEDKKPTKKVVKK